LRHARVRRRTCEVAEQLADERAHDRRIEIADDREFGVRRSVESGVEGLDRRNVQRLDACDVFVDRRRVADVVRRIGIARARGRTSMAR
jgi:hypothetical protein